MSGRGRWLALSCCLAGSAAGWGGTACSGGTSHSDAGVSNETDVVRAEAMLSIDAPLPARADVIALSYTVAASAAREGKSEEGARLARLAADLRLRLYRLERVASDASGAAELLATAARNAPGSEAGCMAEAARARLMGELSANAGTSYREVYLARRRQGALLKAADKSDCIAALDRDLAMLDAFRPTDREMISLSTEGDKAAEQASRGELPLSPPAGPTEPSARSSAAVDPSALGPSDIVVAPPEIPANAGPVKVSSIEKFAAEGGGRVVVNLTGPAAFHVGALAAEGGKDARIFVDIDKATSKGIAHEITVGGAVRRVRTAARDDGTRVVLDLEQDMHRKVFYLPQPFRIVVDVSSRPVEPAAAASTGGARVVKRVVIDPGHGGDDAGAIGPTGLKEKDVTLDIAHRIAPLLSHELSIETLLTRDSDVFVPLEERTARANAFHADLFVSIHCNASENGEARGVESFVLDEMKEVSRASARVAALENGISLKSAGGSKALDPEAMDAEMARIFQGLQSGEVGARSRVFGGLLQRSVLASLSQRYSDTKEHGVKSAGFYVLLGAEMPAVLFETSFVSNPVDESRLATADYRQKLADSVANAIKAYREGR